VADKDGITAALLVAELAAACRARGETLLDRLDDLARRDGVHATAALSVRMTDPGAAVEALRAAPPAALGGRAVERVDDLRLPADDLPPTDGVRLVLAGPGRVVVRPSGTEPKLKCYLEVVLPADDDVPGARARAAADLAGIRADLAALVRDPTRGGA
jgi:phosphomannomutase